LRANWKQLSKQQQATLIRSLTKQEALEAKYEWGFWARDNQWPPDWPWLVWLLLAGRGTGKTRTGVEWVKMQVETNTCKRLALIARTAADVRDVLIEGESGLLSVSRPNFYPKYQPSMRRLTWPNGAHATTYSADEPDLLRGPNHDGALCDEFASWGYLTETFDNLLLGLRLGVHPQVVVMTTPRPIKQLKTLLADPTTAVTRGSTYENLENLAPPFRKQVMEKYEGTRLGRQELYGELLEDVEGALWTRAMIEKTRYTTKQQLPSMSRVVIGVDPAVTSGEDSDETGIVVVGKGVDGRGYVLADRSGRFSPDGWANRVVIAYDEFKADRIIGEANNRGDLVEKTIRTVSPSVSYKKVHASRGKYKRAEPVAALYEQGRISHVGMFAELEDQMCIFTPEGMDTSPDHADALVWACTELFLERKEARSY
jgi:phage terminase large subunit-like protein